MTSTRQWIAGARPRTLPAALAPVLVGTSVAMWDADAIWERALLALVVALALQVGVNYANDYSDGVRGTDAQRVGPVRLVGQGLAEPAAVKRAAVLAFALAGVAGLVLVALSGLWWLLLVGACAIAAAWTYTGGPRPYGYAGFGEVFVFLFFGLVAVGGTAAVQVGFVSALAWISGVGVGALSCAILVVNNLRDIPGDTIAGKRTLAVRIGDHSTRRLYAALVGVALAIPAAIGALGLASPTVWPAAALLGLGAIPLAIQPLQDVRRGARGPALVAVLVSTGRLLLAYGVLLAAGIAIGALTA
ncbi:MAG TPA: 1,4-dihydroxy-2-naphthoate polyprenyltransferase [Motilibacterales bacterium]|nr:1,4-dihydroxy-2-naphthoate polyprenyltransferase [Motilibacterales bacterium]